MKKMLFLFVSLFWLSSVALQAQTRQIKQLKTERNELQKKISATEHLLQSTRKDVKSQLGNLVLLNAQIKEKEAFVKGIKSEVNALSAHQQRLARQLGRLEKELKVCQTKYKHALLFAFRNRLRYGKWMSVLAAKNFREMTRRLRFVTEYGKYQRVQGDAIKEKERQIAQKKKEIAKNQSEKEKLLALGEEQKRELEQKENEQKKIVQQLNRRKSTLQRQIRQHKRDAARLNKRIDDLIQKEIEAAERRRKAQIEKERKAREAARKKAAKSNKGKKSDATSSAPKHVPTVSETTAKERALSGSFTANRGRLPMPITGSYTITSHYGSYKVKGLKNVTLDNKGINLTGRKGAKARCIFNGKVTAIFRLDGLYNVIVRHGSYLSVYCNLQNVSVRKDERVTTRQILGTIARDASGNATLHFQLRKETKRLNPERWVK